MVKIVRKWDVIKKRSTSMETKITIGQDSLGNLYGHCHRCKKNMPCISTFDLKLKKIRKKILCPQCKIDVIL